MAMTRCLDCGTRTDGSRCTICTRRRDRVRNETPSQRARLAITRDQRQRIYLRDGYRCRDCGTARDLTLDHIVPLVVEVKCNYRDAELVTRCRRCNASKGRRTTKPST